jgi:C-terminal processing protease CtpA/Prc
MTAKIKRIETKESHLRGSVGYWHFLSMCKMRHRLICTVLACTFVLSARADQQKMTASQRDAAYEMLLWLRHNVKTSYYDPKLHGVDLEARYLSAKEKLASVSTLSEVYGLGAWLLEPLDDSHTVFLPPQRPYRIEHGWRMGFIGESCYLTAVQPESDAASQGLKPGDQILGMEGFRLERNSAWKLQYSFETLAPRSGMHLIVAAPNSAPRELLVKAKVKKLPTVLDLDFDWRDRGQMLMNKPRIVRSGDLSILKLPNFQWDYREVDPMLAQAAESKTLILDLRGNGGGLQSELTYLLAHVLERDAEIGQPMSRKSEKPLLVKVKNDNKHFAGKLIVLIDSDSASAAEIFARVIQLEKRGTVLGDRSSGRVMEATILRGQTNSAFNLPFALELTISDLIMTDGKSLEHSGVVPDEPLLPTASDLAARRDPVLARAAHLAGIELTPEKAGTLFPIIWQSLE